MITQRSKTTGETKKRLTSAALELFVEKGVDATTTRDIAKRAGISEGAMYRHYESKDMLARDLFMSAFEPFSNQLALIEQRADTLIEKIELMTRYFYQAFDADPAMWRYIVSYQSGPWSKVPKDIETPVSVVLKALQKAEKDGEIELKDIAVQVQLVIGLVTQPAVGVVFNEVELPLSARKDLVVGAVAAVLGIKPRR